MTNDAPILSVQNLSISLGEFALHDVSLEATAGDYVCLIGPTGAGKTILIECVAGLHHPREGHVVLSGVDVSKVPPERRRIGYVPQDYALFPHMNVFDNIAYGLVERGAAKSVSRRKVQAMADLVRIPHLLQRRVSTLSGGEQQRVALARALVLDRQLLLLDEPLGALDWVTKQEVSDYLRDIHDRLGLTVLHVTHDFTEALDLATSVGVIHEGRLLQVGTPEDIFRRPANRTVASFVGMPNLWPATNGVCAECPLLRQIRESVKPPSAKEAWLCVRPDHVVLEGGDGDLSGISSQGTVQTVRWRGASYDVVVDVGTPLVASMGSRDFRALDCRVGDLVNVVLDPQHVHVMADA